MTTPLNCHVKNPPLFQLKIPIDRRHTSWLFTKRGQFAAGITEDKFVQQSELGI